MRQTHTRGWMNGGNCSLPLDVEKQPGLRRRRYPQARRLKHAENSGKSASEPREGKLFAKLKWHLSLTGEIYIHNVFTTTQVGLKMLNALLIHLFGGGQVVFVGGLNRLMLLSPVRIPTHTESGTESVWLWKFYAK